ncbi:hypothetical protein [Burkholderia lata]|uniref:hypothetical protein n=1 Tax=Burkholderia lata (strain ATCC 17760 / DSM 23089 / LMG 22485 / NCIMB 9086 / R18194 / 383) TaxID=482957 RepID=UPI0020C63F47|nr:hypothetical protein [Burkholderia lata]
MERSHEYARVDRRPAATGTCVNFDPLPVDVRSTVVPADLRRSTDGEILTDGDPRRRRVKDGDRFEQQNRRC